MPIEDFDQLSTDDAVALVRSCAEVPRWAREVVRGRPYDDVAALLSAADTLARDWTDADVDGALADHPRIGERHTGAGPGAAHSASEQAAVGTSTDVRTRLADGNRAYEERFDRIFLVRAAGRTAEEILALLEERLTNDEATERAVVKEQLREIAGLRLAGLVGG